MKMRFQGYGIDLSTSNEMTVGSIEPKYVMTSIEANNDSTIGWYTKAMKNIPLIVKGGCYLRLKNMLENHLKFLGRDKADLLLLPVESPWGNLDEDLPVKEYGVLNPTTVEELEEIKKKHKITYISIDTSPFFYNNEVIEWAKAQRIVIIGTNPIGGWLSAARNIQTFTVPFLLKFAAANTDIVMVSGRRLDVAYQDMVFLDEILDSEGAEDFYMRKSIDKLVKPVKKAIDTFSNDNGTLLKYDSPELLFSDVITALAGKKKENMGSLVKDTSDSLQTYLDKISIPEEFSKGEKLALVKYSATEYLRIYYKEEEWNMFYGIVPNSVCAIRLNKPGIPKKHFWNKEVPEENINYMIYLTEDDTIIVKKEETKA